MVVNTSKGMRENPLFMRNQYQVCGPWGIPLVKKQLLDVSDIHLISCANTRLYEEMWSTLFRG